MDYIEKFVEKKLNLLIPFAKEEIREFSENDVVDNDPENVINNQVYSKNTTKNDPENNIANVIDNFANKRQKLIMQFIKMNNKVSTFDIAQLLKTSPSTIKRDLGQLKEKGIIKREGSERGGCWKIIK